VPFVIAALLTGCWWQRAPGGACSATAGLSSHSRSRLSALALLLHMPGVSENADSARRADAGQVAAMGGDVNASRDRDRRSTPRLGAEFVQAQGSDETRPPSASAGAQPAPRRASGRHVVL